MRFTAHERAWRGAGYLADGPGAHRPVTICGVGALGANLAESLARCGVGPLVLIDRDTVEGSNLGTQPYLASDVGSPKADVMAFAVDAAVGVPVRAVVTSLDAANAPRLLRGSRMVVDAFDNHEARACVQRACRELGLPCLHVGMSGDGYGEVRWDEDYDVPAEGDGPPPCDYPLARSLVLLVVGAATEVVLRFLGEERRDQCCVTIGDLTVQAL